MRKRDEEKEEFTTKKKMRKHLTTFQCFGLTFLLAFTVFLGGALLLNSRMFSGNESLKGLAFNAKDEEMEEVFGTDNRVNVLLLGMNHKMADTIMVASFHTQEKTIDLISVPRDTYYERPDFKSSATQKINSIYNTEKENGMQKLAKAVSDVLQGMPLHYYMAVDYEGVGNIVDAMGGVEFNVPFHMKYSDPTDNPPLYIDVEEGLQVLDGENVMEFLRFRKSNVPGYKGYPDGDEGRIRTQQAFMIAAFEQAMDGDLLKIAGAVFENVDSDFTWGTVAKLAAKAMNGGDIEVTTWKVPGEAYMASTKRDSTRLSFYFPDEEQLTEMMDIIYNGPKEELTEGETAVE
ncbi:MAG: LCP family protein [Firmicutes bacterium]|nr:LCP family protein [Bacillota bacterium]